MEWIRNLKIADKLMVLIVIALFFVSVVGVVGFVYSSKANKDVAEMYNDKLIPVKDLGDMRENANANMANLLSMILEERPQDRKPYYDDLKQRLVETKELLSALEALSMGADEKAAMNEYKEALTKYVEVRTRIINLALAGKQRLAWELYQNEAAPFFKAYIDSIGKLTDINVKESDDMYAQSKKDATTSTIMLLVISLASFGLLLTLGTMVSKMITGPISQAVGELDEGAHQVAAASEQLSAASEQLASGTSEQAAAIQETSASIEESDSMVRQNTDNTQEAAVLAKKTKEFADRSQDKMEKMTVSMGELKKSSDDIAKIIKVIDEIAFQTNILALNAAVEAARAGDAGKGFAVVAEEVRNLAQKSAQATKDTAKIIESNLLLSKQNTDMTQEVDSDIKEINLQAQKVSDLLGEIAVASKEQSQGIEQIDKAIKQMEQVLHSNASTAEESASASRELSSQADSVKDIVQTLLVMVEGAEALKTKFRRY